MRDAPREIRRLACLLRRQAADWRTGVSAKLVAPSDRAAAEAASFPVRLILEQPILPTDYVDAKVHNIAIALKRLENLPIPPQSVLSFWHAVGRPSRSNGFRPGRSLLGGRLRPDYGGGLCQLSGLIYHLSLLAGLEVLERHPHSRDIYDDATRYAPLGADATVAYGFKDLRVLNNASAPVCFRVFLSQSMITGCLCCPHPIEAQIVEFSETTRGEGMSVVETRRRKPTAGSAELLCVSTYRSLRVVERELSVEPAFGRRAAPLQNQLK